MGGEEVGMAGKFEIQKAKDGQFTFHFKAGNGRIVITGERYTEKRKAEAGVASVQKNAAVPTRFERKTAKNGQPYFVLKASNGEIIGQSETYSSVGAMEKGIASLQKNAPGARVIDLV
jgi:uncharacterized protein YegP (UPF0339 family)